MKLIYFITLSLLLSTNEALAYIDPNTGGYLFQIFYPIFVIVGLAYLFLKNQIKKPLNPSPLSRQKMGRGSESLKGAMYYNQRTKRPKYSMNLSPNTVNQPIPKGAIAVIKEDYKYIFQIEENRGELYDIKNDPYETNNLINIKGHLAEELKQLVIKKIYHGGKKGH